MPTVAACLALAAALLGGAPAVAQDGTVYSCPGKDSQNREYTNRLTAKEAKARGCTTLQGEPINIVPAYKPPPARTRTEGKASEGAARDKKADSDQRLIFEDELRKAEAALAELKKEYNNGQPERRGDERNYEKYQQRVEDLKSQIIRKEADIENLKREISRLPAAQ